MILTVFSWGADHNRLNSFPDSAESQGIRTNPDFLLWIHLDQFLISWLLSMLGHVLHCKTSAEIWSVPEQLFSMKSKARILQLRFSLQSTKKGAESIEEYVLKMKKLAHSLMAAGQPLADDELIPYILRCLGTEYESVVVNLTSKDSVNLEEVQYLEEAPLL